jgi:LAO/AO transport system kinase
VARISSAIDIDGLSDRLAAGDIQTCAKLITRIEDGDPAMRGLLARLYLSTGRPKVVGFTGPPGVGKSTTIDALTMEFRKRGERVAVLAIDPSSPKTGGAVLGDRVRLARHSEDSGVYIRSMATRGSVGGLALAAADVLVLLGSMPFDVIFLESVGVGQNEIDISWHADPVVVMQTAHSGDVIQTSKAGVLEIGDIFAVNKADDPRTAKMTNALQEMIGRTYSHAESGGWRPPVIETQAVSGLGISDLLGAIDSRFSFLGEHPLELIRRERAQLIGRLRATLIEHVDRSFRSIEQSIDRKLHDVVARKVDPYALADSIRIRIETI